MKSAAKKATITNLFTISNFAPAFNNKAFANNKFASRLSSYYNTLSKGAPGGDKRFRPDYLHFHLPAGKTFLGEEALHGNNYFISFGFQAEAKALGYSAYNGISAMMSHENDKEIHSNDVQFKALNLANTDFAHMEGGLHIPQTSLDKYGNTVYPNDAGSSHGGSHAEIPYNPAYITTPYMASRALVSGAEYIGHYADDEAKRYAGELARWQKINNDEVNSQTTILGKSFVTLKNLPAGLAATAMYDISLANSWIYGGLLPALASGPKEAIEAVDKFFATGINIGKFYANYAQLKMEQSAREDAKIQAKQRKEWNDAPETFVRLDRNGNQVVRKGLKDTSFTYTKPQIKTPQQLQKEAADNQQITNKLNAGIARLQAKQFEEMTGKKVGTAANPLPGQPFASNVPGKNSPVFINNATNKPLNNIFSNQYNRNTNSYNTNRATISQAK